MANNKLDYLITITRGDLNGLTSIMADLAALREIAKKGADFDIRLSAPSVEGIRNQIAEAIGDGIAIPVASPSQKSISKSTADPQVVAKLDALIQRIERVAEAFEKGAGGGWDDTPPPPPSGSTATMTVKSAAASFREMMRQDLAGFTLGLPFPIGSSGGARELEKMERRGSSGRSKEMEDKATISQRLDTIRKERKGIFDLLTRYEDELGRITEGASEEQRTRGDALRLRIRELGEAGQKIDRALKSRKEGVRQAAETLLADWAKDVRGVLESELTSFIDGLSSSGMGRAYVGRRRGGGAPGLTGGSVVFDTVRLSADIATAMQNIAPSLGTSIGNAVASVLRATPVNNGGNGGSPTSGNGGRAANPEEARTKPWNYASTLTPEDQKRTLDNMGGNLVAAAKEAERRATYQLEAIAKGYNEQLGSLRTRQTTVETAIKGRQDQLGQLSTMGTGPDVMTARSTVEQELTALQVEATNIRQAIRQLDEREGKMLMAAQSVLEKARTDVALAQRGQKVSYAADEPSIMGFGTERERFAVEFEPDSNIAKQARQVSRYLDNVTSLAGGPEQGARVRNAMIAVAGNAFMPLVPEAMVYEGMFAQDEGYARMLTARQQKQGEIMDAEARLAFDQISGGKDIPEDARKQLEDEAKKQIAEAKEALDTLEKKMRGYVLERIQQMADETAKQVANLPMNALVGEAGTVEEYEGLVRKLREAGTKQQLFQGNIPNLQPYFTDAAQTGQADMTKTVGILQRDVFAVLQPILKEAVARASAIEDDGSAVVATKAESIAAPLRQLALLQNFLPSAEQLKRSIAPGQDLSSALSAAGRALNPAYNLSLIESPALRSAVFTPRTDEGLPITPLTLKGFTGETRVKAEESLQALFASNPYLAFAPQAPERRTAVDAYMRQIERVRESILRGELPSYVPLGDPKASQVPGLPAEAFTGLMSDMVGRDPNDVIKRIFELSGRVQKAEDGSSYIDTVTGEVLTRVTTAVKERGDADYVARTGKDPATRFGDTEEERTANRVKGDLSIVGGNIMDQLGRDVLAGQVREWDQYLNTRGKTGFASKELFDSAVQQLEAQKRAWEASGQRIISEEVRIASDRRDAQGRRVGGTTDVVLVNTAEGENQGSPSVIDFKTFREEKFADFLRYKLSGPGSYAEQANTYLEAITSYTGAKPGMAGVLPIGLQFDEANEQITGVNVRPVQNVTGAGIPLQGESVYGANPADFRNVIGKFLGLDPDALDPKQLQALEQLTRNVPKIAINPDAYKDVLAALDTRWKLAEQEQLGYGVVYDRRDPYMRDKIDPITGNRITTGGYRGAQGVGQGIGHNVAVTGLELPGSPETLAAQKTLDAMNAAIDSMVKNLSALGGIADPVVKSLEPLSKIAQEIASSMSGVTRALRDAGITTGKGGSRSVVSAAMTAEVRKNVRVQQQRELYRLKDERDAEKEMDRIFAEAAARDTATQQRRLLMAGQATEYERLFEADPRQFNEMFLRTITGSKNQRMSQDRLSFGLLTAVPGSNDELKALRALQRSEMSGMTANMMLAMTGITARRAQPFDGPEDQDPFVRLKRSLDVLLPAATGLDSLALTQGGIEAGTKATNEAERRLRTFEAVLQEYTTVSKDLETVRTARDTKLRLEDRRTRLVDVTQNLRNTSKLPGQEDVEQSLAGMNPVEAANYLAALTFQQVNIGRPQGKQLTREQYERQILNRIIADRGALQPLRRADGAVVEDKDGNEQLDFSTGTVNLSAAYGVVRDARITRTERIREGQREIRALEQQIASVNDTLVRWRDANDPNDTPSKMVERMESMQRTLESGLLKEGGITDTGQIRTANERLQTDFEARQRKLNELKEQLKRVMQEMQKALNMPGSSVDAMRTRIGELTEEYQRLVPEAVKAADAIGRTIKEANKEQESGGGLGRLVNRFKSLAQFAMAGGALYSIIGQVRQAFTTAIDAEYEAKRIQGTLGSKSAGEAQDILTGAFRSASETGTNVRSALDLSRIFAQTGESAPKVAEMTRAALMGQVGAGLEGTQAAEFLIAVENITKGQISSTDIIDRISRVESQYAVSARDLSVAIQRAGSLAQQLQPQANGAVSALDLVIGSATAVIERTRVSGEQASTSLRFIFSRLLQPEVGRELQGRYGIKLGGAEPGSLRPLQDILQDISTRYKQLNAAGRTAEASSLLVTFAGARQANAAAALLDDFSTALAVAKESASAYGDTQQRVNLQLDTLTAQFNRFETGMASLVSNIFTNSSIGWAGKKLVGLAADGAEWLSGDGGDSTGALLGTTFTGGALAYGGARATSAIATRLAAARTAMQVGAFGTRAAAGGALVAGAATGALEIAAIVAALTFLAGALSWGAKKIMETFEDKAAEIAKFDLEKFREEEFYKSYAQQTSRFGVSPESMTTTVGAVATDAQKKLRDEFGKALDDPKATESARIRERAEKLFVEGLLQAVPALKQVGQGLPARAQFQEQLAVGQSFLNTSIKYVNAPISEALANLRSQMTTGLNEAFKNVTALEANFKERFSKGKYPGGMFNRAQERMEVLLGEFGDAMSPFAGDVSGMTLMTRGYWTKDAKLESFLDVLRRVGPDAPFPTMYAAFNKAAQENLVLPDTSAALFQQAAASVSVGGGAVSPAAVLGELLKEYKDRKTIDAKSAEFTDGARIVANQQRLLQDLLPGLRKQYVPSEAATLAGQQSDANLGYSAGEMAYARALRQTLQLGYKNLEEEFRRKAEGKGLPDDKRAQYQVVATNMKGLQDNLARQQDATLLQTADQSRQTGLRAIRERLLDPYVAYGQSLGEIKAMTALRDEYGVDYDPTRAKYDAALRFRQNLGQNEPRIIGDLVRTTFQRFLLGGIDEASYANTQNEIAQTMADMGPERVNVSVPGFSKAMQGKDAERVERQYQASYEQLRAQLKLSKDGLGSLVSSLSLTGNEKNGQAAQNLLASLTDLGQQFENFKVDGEGAGDVFAKLVARLFELQRAAKALSEDVIKEYVASLEKQAKAQREIQLLQARGELRVQASQFEGEQEAARLQALGAMPGKMLEQQLKMQQELTRVSVATYEATYEANLAEIDRQLKEQGADPQKNGALQNRRRDLINQRDIFLEKTGQTDEQTQTRLRNQQINTLVSQQTEQIRAVIENGLMQPMRGMFMNYRNFDRKNLYGLVESLGAASQEALVGQFMERLQFLIGNPIVEAFRSGGLYSKQFIVEGFRDGVKFIPPAGGTRSTGAGTPSSSQGPAAPAATAATAGGVVTAKDVFSTPQRLPDATFKLDVGSLDLGSAVQGTATEFDINALTGFTALNKDTGDLTLSDGSVIAGDYLKAAQTATALDTMRRVYGVRRENNPYRNLQQGGSLRSSLEQAQQAYGKDPLTRAAQSLEGFNTTAPADSSPPPVLTAEAAPPSVNVQATALDAVVDPIKKTRWWNKQRSFGKGKWGQTGDAAASLAGSLGGAALGNAVSKYKGNNFAQEGAAMVSMLGSMTPLGPVGGIVGGVVGGMLGGLLKKNDDKNDIQTEALQKIERNTREAVQAFENQTALLQLDSRFLNVPTGFTVPQYQPFGVGSAQGSNSVTVNSSFQFNFEGTNGVDENDLAQRVSSAIRSQLNNLGNSFDLRTM